MKEETRSGREKTQTAKTNESGPFSDVPAGKWFHADLPHCSMRIRIRSQPDHSFHTAHVSSCSHLFSLLGLVSVSLVSIVMVCGFIVIWLYVRHKLGSILSGSQAATVITLEPSIKSSIKADALDLQMRFLTIANSATCLSQVLCLIILQNENTFGAVLKFRIREYHNRLWIFNIFLCSLHCYV